MGGCHCAGALLLACSAHEQPTSLLQAASRTAPWARAMRVCPCAGALLRIVEPMGAVTASALLRVASPVRGCHCAGTLLLVAVPMRVASPLQHTASRTSPIGIMQG